MGLSAEIFEGLDAFDKAKKAVWDPEYEMRTELYKEAKRENDDWEERKRSENEDIEEYRRRKAAGYGGPAGTPGVQTQAATGMPGTNTNAPAVQTGLPPNYPYTMPLPYYGPGAMRGNPRYGGYYGGRRFAEGGYVPEDNTDTMPSFDPNGPDYDYRSARLAGIHRGRDGHMASRDPVTGMQLKGRAHPTFDTAIDEDRRQGYGLEMRDGRYYTQPFKAMATGAPQRMRRGGKPGEPVPDLGTMPSGGDPYGNDRGEMKDRDPDRAEGEILINSGRGPEVGPNERGMTYDDLMALHRKDPIRYPRPRWRTPLRPNTSSLPAGTGSSQSAMPDRFPVRSKPRRPGPTPGPTPSALGAGQHEPTPAIDTGTPPSMRPGVAQQAVDDDPDSESELLVKSLLSRDIGAPDEPPPVQAGEFGPTAADRINEMVGDPDAPLVHPGERDLAPEREINRRVGAPNEPPPVDTQAFRPDINVPPSDYGPAPTAREIAPERTIREGMGDFDVLSDGTPWPERRAELLTSALDPSSEYRQQGEADRIAKGREDNAAMIEASRTDDELARQTAGVERDRNAQLDREGQALLTGQPPTESDEKTSGVGRAIKAEITTAPGPAAIGTINGKIHQLNIEKQKLDPGMFRQTTAAERREIARKTAAIDAEIAKLEEMKAIVSAGDKTGSAAEDPVAALSKPGALDKLKQAGRALVTNLRPMSTVTGPVGAKPAQPGASAPTPASPAPAGPVPGESVVRVKPRSPQQDPTYQPPFVQPPSVAQAPPGAGNDRQPNQVPPQGSNDQSSAGSNGPQQGTGTTPAPPPGTGTQTAANAPSTAPKAPATPSTQAPAKPQTAVQTDAPGPGGRRVPKGSLEDQTRTKAFDPTGKDVPTDPTDPHNIRAVDASGRTYGPEEIAPMVQSAVSAMRPGPNGEPPVIGQGAVRPQTYDRFAQQYSNGGRLSKGEAALVGMISQYRSLLKQGRIREASMMAAGVMQAANLEAAVYGRTALDAYNRGDYNAAGQKFVDGVNNFPDGKTHEWRNGTIVVKDPYTGAVIDTARVTPQQLLAGIMGLQDGTSFWAALQASASMFQQPDKNATLRQLDEEIKRRRIKKLDQELANPKGGTPAKSAAASQFDAGFYGNRQNNSGADGNQSGGNDGSGREPDYGDDGYRTNYGEGNG